MKVSLFVVIACLNSGDGFYDHSSLSSILSAYKARLKISRFEAVSVSATTAALTNPVDQSPVEEQFPVENHIPVEDQSPVEKQFPIFGPKWPKMQILDQIWPFLGQKA